MKEKLKKMTNAELITRRDELKAIGENPESRSVEELEQLAEERNLIEEELTERRAAAARDQLRRDGIAAGSIGTNVLARQPEPAQQRNYGPDSAEYRTAWLKKMAVRDGVALFGELNEEETRAYTHTTANTGAVVPTAVMNRIVELVESEYPMYNDASKSAMVQGFQIPRHTAIAAGDAAATNEGAANSDEQDTFDYLPLAGVEIKKHIVISRKMKWQSISAFEDWIVTHIAERIGVAKEARILSQLGDATYGIAAANVATGVEATDANIRAKLGLVRGTGAKVLYANAYTIWNILAGINDGAGNKAFIPSPQADPVTKGVVYGYTVKEDNNLANKVIYAGAPSKILANNFEDLFINRAMDPKTFEDIVAGYSLFDAGLENPLAFVKVTFQ
jgi:HK97 family phage major capsid protein